ncbi:hypothetical protein L0F63_001404 [Massospora cicadina]|nr:hypothetical protein L0F63_001404 [Massospora cicadina]
MEPSPDCLHASLPGFFTQASTVPSTPHSSLDCMTQLVPDELPGQLFPGCDAAAVGISLLSVAGSSVTCGLFLAILSSCC